MAHATGGGNADELRSTTRAALRRAREERLRRAAADAQARRESLRRVRDEVSGMLGRTPATGATPRPAPAPPPGPAAFPVAPEEHPMRDPAPHIRLGATADTMPAPTPLACDTPAVNWWDTSVLSWAANAHAPAWPEAHATHHEADRPEPGEQAPATTVQGATEPLSTPPPAPFRFRAVRPGDTPPAPVSPAPAAPTGAGTQPKDHGGPSPAAGPRFRAVLPSVAPAQDPTAPVSCKLPPAPEPRSPFRAIR